MNAWKEACAATEPSTVVIPTGKFLLNPVTLQGPCKAPIELQVQGTIIAPEDHSIFKGDGWVLFHNIDGLTLSGGGTFDALGSKTWSANECYKTISCEDYPIVSSFSNFDSLSVPA